MEKKKAVAVVGPTASGKTKLAVEIAKRFNGEVVSFDSMQIYKGMDIASAKPTVDEMDGVVHHLVSVKDLSERYSVASFVEDAKAICNDIVSRNCLPVFCGGTGLYIDSFVNNIEFTDEGFDENIRNELLLRLEKEGSNALYDELMTVDEEYAKTVDCNNTKRVIRALELYYNTKTKMSDQLKNSRLNESDYDVLYIGLNYSDRQLLYNRINERVDKMVSCGLINEAEQFFKLNDVKTANQAIGIKELKPYFDGEITLDEAIEKIKQETRRYAKRQLTWFNRNKNINWIIIDKSDDINNEAFELVNGFLKGEN
ncbi:MAG: tRNA (adenosine(37)-N6)-dimethylallyltransferase MiaA [Ruminococcaceae bacterium]|jgi:tRNA dimethylallyltransferase|nr:tRNA (adenosine(37)-N6)-dimethylallyltransferase MiaA [Oscillospiraceae bacterium]